MALVMMLTAAIYLCHLRNEFHFDDAHAVVQNPYIREIGNVPRFFVDARTSSVLPTNRTYRPVLFVSLALDYWAGGLSPIWYHVDSLVWFLVEVWLVFLLARRIIRVGSWVPVFSAAIYALHPVMAETVNYVVQRAEIQSSVGVLAGLLLFPRQWYLLPVALGILAKPTAIVFPVLLVLWLVLIDRETVRGAVRKSIPSTVVAASLGAFCWLMTPASFNPGSLSPWDYRMTQPMVAARYFFKFIVPTGLTADTDHVPLASFLDDGVILGFLFVGGLVWVIVWAARRGYRSAVFGLGWFLVGLLPTSLMALAEVENDHRMFLPFVGLAIAGASLAVRSRWTIVVACGVLGVFACGSWERCEVWRTEESLWKDVTLKSPRNGRGLMNYGLTLMNKGDYAGASYYFEQGAFYMPNYYVLEINRGIAFGGLNRQAEAEIHFQRSLSLAPHDSGAKYFYARWLHAQKRSALAASMLTAAIAENPDYLDAYYLLIQIDWDRQDNAVVSDVSRLSDRFPSDQVARMWKVWLHDHPIIKR